VKRALERAMAERDWSDAGQGWQGKETNLRLLGWSRQRRVVLLRRLFNRPLALLDRTDPGQPLVGFAEVIGGKQEVWQYAALVTSLGSEILTLGQLYRDRAGCENAFHEPKNHWGLGGFTTRDFKRCRLLAASVALIYNWWSLFVRPADPDQHREVNTSRPLLLQAIARKTQHAGQTTLSVSSTHGEQQTARRAYLRIARFFAGLRAKKEQLDAVQRWYCILSEALRKYLHGRQLIPPARLQPTRPASYSCKSGRKLPPRLEATAGFRLNTKKRHSAGGFGQHAKHPDRPRPRRVRGVVRRREGAGARISRERLSWAPADDGAAVCHGFVDRRHRQTGWTSARALFVRVGALAVVLWALVLSAIIIVPVTFPHVESASFFNKAPVEPPRPLNLVALYIPSNLFHSLANNIVPAVVLFSIVLGVALIGVERKGILLDNLAAIEDALKRANRLLFGLAPLGLFAIAAHTMGTVDTSEFAKLRLYLISYAAVALSFRCGFCRGLLRASRRSRSARSSARPGMLSSW
jgi:hypothetical protein